MKTASSFVSSPFVFPLLVVLLAIYQFLVFLHIPFALGFSIIVFTLLIRFILAPVTASQLKISKKMQQVAPHINKLKEKHKNDAKMLQQETMRIYKEHGVNPAAGCLPAIIQLPIIWSLYNMLIHVVNADPKQTMLAINSHLPTSLKWLSLSRPWDAHFFGIPISSPISHLITSLGPVIVLIPIITAALQLIQSKMLIAPKGETDKLAKKADDFASAFQTQSVYLFPIMIGFFSFSLPVGLSLYWNTFTIFGILQQYLVLGLGGLVDWLPAKYKTKK